MRNLLAACALFAIGCPCAVRAQSAADVARSGTAKQGEIRSNTEKLCEQLDGMIDEYGRNGLAGDDVDTLKSLRGVLSKLSDQDMQKILGVLHDAAAAGKDPAGTLKALADAYSQQKGVLVEFRKILADYADTQEAVELSHTVGQLADRQAANLQTAIETARWSQGSSHSEAAVSASLEGQDAEQKAIGEEFAQATQKMAKLAANQGNQAIADRFAQGQQKAAAIAPLLAAASGALESANLSSATDQEKTARDQIRELARLIAPPRDPAAETAESAAELDKLIAQQQDVITTTGDSVPKPIDQFITTELMKGNRSPLYRDAVRKDELFLPTNQIAAQDWVRSHYYGPYMNYSRNLANGLGEREADLADRDDTLRQELSHISPPAAAALAAAAAPMQGAQAALTDSNSAGAIPNENTALAAMQKARDALLQTQIAAQTPKPPPDPMAVVRDLQRKTQALLASQTALANQAAAHQPGVAQQQAAQQQATLHQAAQKVAQQAAAVAPDAAQSLAAAAQNMQQAAAALASSQAQSSQSAQASQTESNQAQPNQAQASQAQAAQNLAKASDQLNQQVAEINRAGQQLAAQTKAADDLAKIISNEQRVQVDTGVATANPKSVALRALAPHQAAIQRDLADLQHTLAAAAANPPPGSANSPASPAGNPPPSSTNAPASPAANAPPNSPDTANSSAANSPAASSAADEPNAKAAADANATMEEAQAHLAAADGPKASAAEAHALTQLNSLRDNLEAKLAAAAHAAGGPPGAAAAAARASAETAAHLARAQAETAHAQGAMSQAAPAPASQQAAAQGATSPLTQAASEAQQAAVPIGLPTEARQALQAATQELAAAAAHAAQGNNAGAQSSAAEAQSAMAQASSALAQAQAGIATADPNSPLARVANQQPPSNSQSDPSQKPGQPGEQSANGEGSKGEGEATTPSASLANGKTQYLALPARDRATIQQSQSEKYPQQYATKIEQYLQNLSDESAHP